MVKSSKTIIIPMKNGQRIAINENNTMANKYILKCSTFFLIKEMQIKMRCYFTYLIKRKNVNATRQYVYIKHSHFETVIFLLRLL